MVLLLDSGRFETFIDAIFAIMMTIMVIKIPQPETLSLSGLMESSVMYLSYLISFIIIASIWNNHRKLFDRIKDIDNFRAYDLAMAVIKISNNILKNNGNLIMKAFQGEAYQDLIKTLKKQFKTVKTTKPNSSRKRSAEMYVIARGFKGSNKN